MICFFKTIPGDLILCDGTGNVMTTFCKQSVSSAIHTNSTDFVLMLWGNALTTPDFLERSGLEIAQRIVDFCGGNFRVVFKSSVAGQK